MSSFEIDSLWKTVEAKFPKCDPSRQSLEVPGILDLLNKSFSEDELSSVTHQLLGLVKQIYDNIEPKAFWEFYGEISDFQDDIKKFQTKYPQISFINDRLKMVLFILSLLKSKISGVILRFIKNFFPMYPSFGMMFCQTLCDPNAIENANKVLEGDSIDKARNNMLKAMKELFTEGTQGSVLLNIIHMISSCGEYKTSIIDEEMEHEMNLNYVPLMAEDGKVLSIAVHHCTHLRKFSLRNCKLDSKCLQALYSGLISSQVQIMELDVSWNENMDFSILAKLFKKHQVQKLGMRDCSLNSKKLNAFAEQSGEKKIMELDVSYSQDMDFSILGKLFKKHQVQKLIMQCCALNLEKLNDFAEQSGEGEILELDVSINEDMNFSVLGKLFKKHQVQKLKMLHCSLNFEKLNAFIEQSGEGKILELDVSGNGDMDFSILGKLFKKHQVQKLGMRGCSLNFKKLNAFNEQSAEEKVIELDVSSNKDMNFSVLGKFFKKHQVLKLGIRNCSLNFEKLNAFAEQSGEGKIVEIDVSFNKEMGVDGLSCLDCLIEKHLVERLIMWSCGLNYQNLNGIKEGSALRKMFSVVSEYIDISGNNFIDEDISDLEKNLHLINETNLELQIKRDCYLCSIAGISTSRLSAEEYAEKRKRESEKVSTGL